MDDLPTLKQREVGTAWVIANEHIAGEDPAFFAAALYRVMCSAVPSYADGVREGLEMGATKLREAALEHYRDGEASKKVLESQAHQLAGVLLSSWANGLERDASKNPWSEREKAIQAVVRNAGELLSVMSEFHDRPDLWGEAVAMLDVALEHWETEP